ncbi:MAG TPA: hypothetical protein VGM03_01650 [Phycisphaerae bacterium]|jgi:hypothetical protein
MTICGLTTIFAGLSSGCSSTGEREPIHWRFWEKRDTMPAATAGMAASNLGYPVPATAPPSAGSKSDQDFAYRMNQSHSQAERAEYQQKLADRARKQAERSVKQAQKQQQELQKRERQRSGSDAMKRDTDGASGRDASWSRSPAAPRSNP